MLNAWMGIRRIDWWPAPKSSGASAWGEAPSIARCVRDGFPSRYELGGRRCGGRCAKSRRGLVLSRARTATASTARARTPAHASELAPTMNNTPGTAEPAGTPAPKPRPTMARLREAMTALGVHGMCRLVAFELLTYWEPGGTVFPSVTTLADGLGVQPRIVRGHLARLERIGLWVRVARPGRANLYELRLPVFVSDETEPRIVGSAPPGSHDPPEVTNEVTKKVQAAAVPAVLSLPPPDQQQQQRLRRTEDRIEGLFGAIAARARQLRVKYDEQDERARLKAGEIDVDALQRLADELGEDLQQRRVRL